MVNTRRSNRNTQGSGPAEGQGDRAESRNRTPANQQNPNAQGNLVIDTATMEVLRNLVLQTIQDVLPIVQTATPGVGEDEQAENIEVECNTP